MVCYFRMVRLSLLYILVPLLIVPECIIGGVPNLHRRQEEVRQKEEVIDTDDFLANFLENFPEIIDETRSKPTSAIITDSVKVPQYTSYDPFKYPNPTDDDNVLVQDIPDNTARIPAPVAVIDPIPSQEDTIKLEARSDIVTGFGAMAAVITSAVTQFMSFLAKKKLLIVAVIAGVLGTIGISEVFTDDLMGFAESITGERIQRQNSNSNFMEPTLGSQDLFSSQQLIGGYEIVQSTNDNYKMVNVKPVTKNSQSENLVPNHPNTSDTGLLHNNVSAIIEEIELVKNNEGKIEGQDIGLNSHLDMEGLSEEDTFIKLEEVSSEIKRVAHPIQSYPSDINEEDALSSLDVDGENEDDAIHVAESNLAHSDVERMQNLHANNVTPMVEDEGDISKSDKNGNDKVVANNKGFVASLTRYFDPILEEIDPGVAEVSNTNVRQIEDGRTGAGKLAAAFSSAKSEQGVDHFDTNNINSNELDNAAHKHHIELETDSEAQTFNITPMFSAEKVAGILDANLNAFSVSDDTEMQINTFIDFDVKTLNQEEQVETTTEQYKDIFETLELKLEMLPSTGRPLKEHKTTIFVNEEVADDGNMKS